MGRGKAVRIRRKEIRMSEKEISLLEWLSNELELTETKTIIKGLYELKYKIEKDDINA